MKEPQGGQGCPGYQLPHQELPKWGTVQALILPSYARLHHGERQGTGMIAGAGWAGRERPSPPLGAGSNGRRDDKALRRVEDREQGLERDGARSVMARTADIR